jgi:FkbM family methyltransferase
MAKNKLVGSSKAEQGLLSQIENLETSRGQFRFFKNETYTGEASADTDGDNNSAFSLMLDDLRDGQVVFDIGAHAGFHAVAFAEKVGETGQVWAFEPDVNYLILLALNIKNSAMGQVIKVVPAAPSSQLGVRKFQFFDFSKKNYDGHSGIDDLSGRDYCLTLPLDLIGDALRPDLVRLAARGLEIEALKGMRQLLRTSKPRLFVALDSHSDFDETMVYLSQLGYDVYGFSVDPVDKKVGPSALYCVIPAKHTRPRGLVLLLASAKAEDQNQFLEQAREETSALVFSTEENTLGHAASYDAEQAFWAWRSLRRVIREFVTGTLKIGLTTLNAEHHGSLIRAALEYIAAENSATEWDALQQLLFQALKSLRISVQQGGDQAKLIKALETNLESQASELSVLATSKNQALDRLTYLKDDFELSQSRAQTLMETIENLTAQKRSIEADLLAVQQQEAALNLALATSQSRKAEEIATLKLRAETASKLETEVEGLRGELLDHLARQASEEAKCANLEERLIAREAELATAQAKVEELLATEEASKAMAEALQLRIGQVKAQLQDRDDAITLFKAEIESQGKQHSELQLSLETLTHEQSELLSQVNERDATEKANFLEVEAQLASKESEIARCEAKIEELVAMDEASQAMTNALQQKIAHLNAQLLERDADITALKDGLEAQKQKSADLEAAQEALDGKHAEKRAQADAVQQELEARIAALDGELEAQKQKSADLEAAQEALDGKHAEKRAQADAVQKELEAHITVLDGEREALESALAEKRARADASQQELEARITALNGDLEAQRKAIAILEASLETVGVENAKSIALAEAEKLVLKQSLDDMAAKIQQKSDLIEQFKRNHTQSEQNSLEDLELLKQHFRAFVSPDVYEATVLRANEIQHQASGLEAELKEQRALEADLRALVRMQSEELLRLKN